MLDNIQLLKKNGRVGERGSFEELEIFLKNNKYNFRTKLTFLQKKFYIIIFTKQNHKN